MKLNDLYTSILACGGMVVDKEGFVSVSLENNTSPALVSSKRLVLPTQSQLISDQTNKIVFHPLAENILKGESDVIEKLRSVFNIRLNYTFAAVAHNLLTIAGSISDHKKLTPDQSELLSIVKDVDEKTVVAFTSMMVNSIKDSPERSFVNIFLKRGAIIGGKKWSRGGIVTFPLLEQLEKEQDKYYGVKLRAKDKAAFIQLYEYLLPNSSIAEFYNRGTDSDVAPFLDGLMKTVMGIASKLNDVLVLFSNQIDSSEDLMFNSDWVETFDNLAVMLPQIRQIPMQIGNEGKSKLSDTQQVNQVQKPEMVYQTPVPVQQVVNQPPQYQNQSQQFSSPGFLQQQFTPPVMQPPPMVETDKGVTFDSFMRNHPALAQNAVRLPQFNQAPVQQPYVPRWAQQQAPVFGQQQNPMFQGNPGFNQGNNWGSGRV